MASTANVPASTGRITGEPALTAAASAACAIVMLAAALAYVNSLGNPFVYDDFLTVVNNGSIVDLAQLRMIALHDVARPLVNLSYALDRAVWGSGPVGYHVTNVVLHVFNVGLLFVLATWLALDARRAGETFSGRGPLAAFVAAGLFALHPMMSGAVGYISARSELLCATFFLLAVICARQWIVDGGKRRWLFATIGCWLLALASKEVAAVLPAVVLWYERTFFSAPPSARRTRLWRLHVPLFGLAVAAVAVRLAVFAGVEQAEAAFTWRYGLVELDVFRRYLGLMLLPIGQSIAHDVVALDGAGLWRPLAGVVVVGSLVAGAWLLRRRVRLVGLGVTWFFLLLVPSAVLVMLDRGEPMVEHRVYVAAAGFFLAAGSLVGGWLDHWLRPAWRPVLRGAAVLLMVVMAASTVARNRVWRDPVALWSEAVQRSPEAWLPHLLLGEAQHAAGRHAEAVASFEEVLRLRPDEHRGYARLGLCLAELGRDEAAVAVFQRLQALDPLSADAQSGLGVVAFFAGRTEDARAHFLAAVELAPDHVDARRGLAMIAESFDDDPAAALRWCEQIAMTAPGAPGVAECIARNRARLGGGG